MPREVGGLRIDPFRGSNGCIVMMRVRAPISLPMEVWMKGAAMTRTFITFTLLLSAAPASAHVGHLGEFAGHDHWVAGAALGAALAVSIWGALKGKKDAEKAEAETHEDAEEEAA